MRERQGALSRTWPALAAAGTASSTLLQHQQAEAQLEKLGEQHRHTRLVRVKAGWGDRGGGAGLQFGLGLQLGLGQRGCIVFEDQHKWRHESGRASSPARQGGSSTVHCFGTTITCSNNDEGCNKQV